MTPGNMPHESIFQPNGGPETGVNEQSFDNAKHYALHRLELELSPNLLYHGIVHTRDDVVPAAEKLASMEGVTGESWYLLRTAAWFHDLGFVEQPANHELISARIASEVLPGFGYSASQVETVCRAIFATIIPQSPRSLIDMITADADLNVLGRSDFLSRNRALRDELALLGREFTDAEWYAGQIGFAEKHSFFTHSAAALWNEQKSRNVADLKRLLDEAACRE